MDSLQTELMDVEDQLKSSTPIITFLKNKLRMNDLYARDESQSNAWEYEKVSLVNETANFSNKWHSLAHKIID